MNRTEKIFLCNYFIKDVADADGISRVKGELMIAPVFKEYGERLLKERPDLINYFDYREDDDCICTYVQANNAFLATNNFYTLLQNYEKSIGRIIIV